MLRLLLLISLLLSSLTLVESTSATVIYTPGAMIAMTGSNTDVRFDVASALYDYKIANPTADVASRPALDTSNVSNLTFTGTFYGSGIGWIVFASGSNQVSLSCSEALNVLTSNCTLTGTGWNENVGDIYFAGVVYNPGTGRLSGSAITFVGDISLAGIALPLRAVTLEQLSLIANHAAMLSAKDAWIYDAGATPIWDISIMPLSGFFAPSTSHNDGSFSIDFSLATSYAIKITDTNGSETTISPFVVNPDVVITTPTTAPGYYADTFCSTATLPDLSCPDGANRRVTTLDKAPVGSVVADGAATYSFTLKARDQYGNRVGTGNVRIIYDTTVKNIQTDPLNGTDNIHYGPSNDGDAFISDKIPNGFFGTSDTVLTLNTSDITYTIASTAPTNLNNEIRLSSIEYNGSDIALIGWKTALSFAPLFIASVTSGTPIVNTPHTFETTVVTNRTTSITPTIITTMQIGNGSSAEWRSLYSSPTAECSNYPSTITTDPLCDWSSVSVIATSSASDFAYTGTYVTWLPSTVTDTTTMTGYIYYTTLGKDILYSNTMTPIAAANPATPRITILGQSGEGVGGGSRARVDLINSIRKQTALLSRNRSNYDDVDYLVVNGDHTITATELDGEPSKKAKRSIIIIGGDITIADNISLRDYPIAIIALTDATGKGGNIRIKGAVKDIHSSLIAEYAITSVRSDSQLYIHGSLISANPPREIAPTGCPYFAASGCTRSDYDLPGSRDAYAALTDKTGKSSIGGSIYPSPFVIEGDPRIIRDPAPAMSR